MTTLHLVTHTHWDREWYLTFQQFRLRLVHLVDHLLDLLAADPGFKHFMLDGQTIVLEDYLAVRPEREAELCEHLRSGRVLIGPWYVLPDEFLVSPEALLRNLLQGDRMVRRWSGQKMMVGYLPDTFGHIGQMPQILRGFKLETACLTRGLADEPCELWWQSPDGGRVLLAYQRDSYGNAAGLPTSEPERFLAEISRLRDALLPYAASGHILLMHGTDHTIPPIDTGDAVAYANRALAAAGDRLVHSTLPAYLEAVQEAVEENKIELPVITGELRSSSRFPLLPGVLSTRLWIKQRNAACQTLLEKWAEPFSTWAEYSTADLRLRAVNVGEPLSAVGGSPRWVSNPAPLLREAWRLLLQCHPHDSICGCSIDQVHEEMRPRFDQVEQMGEELTRQSLEILAAKIDTRLPEKSLPGLSIPPGSLLAGEGPTAPGGPRLVVSSPRSAIIVFNPSCGPRADLVQAELELPVGLENFEIVDEAGEVLPHQVVETSVQEIFNMPLDRDGLRSALAMVQGGQVGNMTVREVGFRREAEILYIDLVMAEEGQPDPESLRQGLLALDKWLADETVSTFLVRARSAMQAKVEIAARGIPEYGFRTFWLRPAHSPGPFPVVSPLDDGLENEFFKVEVSPETGAVSLLDKRTGLQLSGLNRFVDGGDCGDEYNYMPPAEDEFVSVAKIENITVRHGPAQQALEISLVMEVPEALAPDRRRRSAERVLLPISTRLSLVPGLPRLDIRTMVDNGPAGLPARARDHRLRVHFPAPFPGQAIEEAVYDGHFELVRRPVGALPGGASWIEQPRPEKPQRAFTSLCHAQFGLVIANRGLPEVEVIPGAGATEIALTLMRCVGWLSRGDLSARKGHAGPMHATPGAQMPGLHTFDYAIIPHASGQDQPSSLSAYRHAFAFNAPMRAAGASLHPGELSPMASLVRVLPHAFMLSAIKTAEDGLGWIVRGYNLTAEPLQVTLVPWRPFRIAQRVDLNEQILEDLACAEDGRVSLPVSGCEIATVKFSV